ncbi:ornithine decarboxylase antizyme 2 [Hyalella azteca]|uniref:Ornithine decarboxylase antizyme n=1 Tax=Hyalella azteca TaxID=294128 RepID=A0A979FG74_HYAAZ|nr:ornithine decarboxylase antizyme 2 [Hyalella azteca]
MACIDTIRCPSSLSSWVGDVSGGFDAPHTANVSYNTEGSGVGSLVEPPVAEQKDGNSNGFAVSESELLAVAGRGKGARLRFSFQLCEQTAVVWEAVLFKRCLYLQPGDSLPDGSKEAFVALLEFTEVHLQCRNIIVCLNKQARNRACLVRTFMFLGFAVVPPGHPLAPKGEYLSLLYSLDEDDEDNDEEDEGFDALG